MALAVVACGPTPEGEALPYVNTFMDLARAHDRDALVQSVTFQLEDLAPAKERIDCSGRTKTVAVDALTWSAATPDDREAMVYHVLAHCLLTRGHRTGGTTASAITEPWSLMRPGFVPGILYRPDQARYVEELFAVPVLNDTPYP